MTKREQERYWQLEGTMRGLGFTRAELDALLRASKVLSTWAEHEASGVIQRDGEQGDGRPYWYSPNTGKRLGPTADRERGALARVKGIVEAHGLTFYHQTDPRGCALYIIRPGDIPPGAEVGSCYTNGIAMCL